MNLKLIIEDNLHKIDQFFKEKSQKDTYYVYIMIVAIIGAIAYPFYDLSIDEFKASKTKVNNLKIKIDMDNAYLDMNPESKIAKIDQEIKRLDAQVLALNDNNNYIKKKIETISSLVYDEVAWGEYINSISINAKKYNIKIINYTNEYSTNNKSFGHILDIDLEVRGRYMNTLKFINSLEKSDLVVDIHTISIKAQNALNTKLAISVWGITY